MKICEIYANIKVDNRHFWTWEKNENKYAVPASNYFYSM